MRYGFLFTHSISRLFFQFPWLGLGEHNCLKNAESLLARVTMKKYRYPFLIDQVNTHMYLEELSWNYFCEMTIKITDSSWQIWCSNNSLIFLTGLGKISLSILMDLDNTVFYLIWKIENDCSYICLQKNPGLFWLLSFRTRY